MPIEVKNISKQYGNKKILRSVSFSAQENEILVLLGSNGSGKSTTLRIISGFFAADMGSVQINGLTIEKNRKEYLKQIGYLPENNPLYPEMYVKEYLNFMAEMYQLKEKAKTAVDNIIEQTGLGIMSKKKIGQLSKGYRQRVGLAGVLLHNPSVLLLDEPGTGLDLEQEQLFYDLLLQISHGRILIFTTHCYSALVSQSCHLLVLSGGFVGVDVFYPSGLSIQSFGEYYPVG